MLLMLDKGIFLFAYKGKLCTSWFKNWLDWSLPIGFYQSDHKPRCVLGDFAGTIRNMGYHPKTL